MKYTQTVNKSNITLNLVNFCTQNSTIFLHQKFKFFAQTCSVVCNLVQLELKFSKINQMDPSNWAKAHLKEDKRAKKKRKKK